MDKIRIVVIEDNRLLREGITATFAEQPDFIVVAAFGDGDKIIQKIHDAKPHLLLLDIGLRNQNSLKLVKTVTKELPAVKIIAMDLVPVQEDIYEFVQAGVSGFILKDSSISNVIKTMRSVAEGTNVLPSFLTESLFSQIVTQAIIRAEKLEEVEDAVVFSKRERNIIMLIAEGLANKEIGERLNISTYTVKSHVHNIMEKLAIRSRLQIANFAHTNKDFKEIVNSVSLIVQDNEENL